MDFNKDFQFQNYFEKQKKEGYYQRPSQNAFIEKDIIGCKKGLEDNRKFFLQKMRTVPPLGFERKLGDKQDNNNRFKPNLFLVDPRRFRKF